MAAQGTLYVSQTDPIANYESVQLASRHCQYKRLGTVHELVTC
jgi:hypothetical protein